MCIFTIYVAISAKLLLKNEDKPLLSTANDSAPPSTGSVVMRPNTADLSPFSGLDRPHDPFLLMCYARRISNVKKARVIGADLFSSFISYSGRLRLPLRKGRPGLRAAAHAGILKIRKYRAA